MLLGMKSEIMGGIWCIDDGLPENLDLVGEKKRKEYNMINESYII